MKPLPLEISNWRREERKRLLEHRRTLSSDERTRLVDATLINLRSVFETLRTSTLGLYWPIKREIDIRRLAADLSLRERVQLALPVVVAKHQPLEYWLWCMGAPMTRGFWNIPVPKTRTPVDPDVIIAPLVGFSGYYRLGYGGGYFDRTLAARVPRPTAIGIGFEFSRLDGFMPQPHDIPMDIIVTDSGIAYAGHSAPVHAQ